MVGTILIIALVALVILGVLGLAGVFGTRQSGIACLVGAAIVAAILLIL